MVDQLEHLQIRQEDNPVPVWLRTLLILVISVLIILSNILNIAILRKIKGLPTIARMCMINLGVADITVGLITCVPSFVPAITNSWPYGDIWCQVSGVVHGTSVTVSIWTLAIISVDRYMALVKPFRYPSVITSRKIYVVFGMAWFLAAITFMAPIPTEDNFIYYHFSRVEMLCGLYWQYPIFCIITAAGIPIASGSVILFTTISISLTVRKDNHFLTCSRKDFIRARKRIRDLKSVRILITTASAFFVFWGPYVTNVVIYSFDRKIHAPAVAEFAFIWMANSNSFINVLIYSFIYKKFRLEIRNIFRHILKFCKIVTAGYKHSEAVSDVFELDMLNSSQI
ncbi:tachykinin-like peptides receptor 86C [Gigantopelta aegis]|uniref:tachykinin-like peptides receptor 86C n=1 Tax=Gigantopelta aegis TaxID=1735272 RepID=UPI001B88D6CC|nr:tachykinin-like peptides receptor 86C [Gigantopelta aegis]